MSLPNNELGFPMTPFFWRFSVWRILVPFSHSLLRCGENFNFINSTRTCYIGLSYLLNFDWVLWTSTVNSNYFQSVSASASACEDQFYVPRFTSSMLFIYCSWMMIWPNNGNNISYILVISQLYKATDMRGADMNSFVKRQ